MIIFMFMMACSSVSDDTGDTGSHPPPGELEGHNVSVISCTKDVTRDGVWGSPTQEVPLFYGIIADVTNSRGTMYSGIRGVIDLDRVGWVLDPDQVETLNPQEEIESCKAWMYDLDVE